MNKCRIVPSGTMTRNFCKKIIKQLGLSETIILDIEDLDGNGKYDIKDFLVMKNEEIIKMNNGQKFDICLMNPPYGTKETDKLIHIKFVDKCLDMCNNIVCVMPSIFIKNKNNAVDYRTKFSQCLISAEFVSSDIFNGTNFDEVAIYEFGNNNGSCVINGKIYSSLKEYDTILFNNDKVLNYIYNIINKNNIYKSNIHCIPIVNLAKYKTDDLDKNLNRSQAIEKYINNAINNRLKKYQDKIYLMISLAVGTKKNNKIAFIDGKGGKIFDFNTLKQYIINEHNSSGYNILIFNDLISAHNCKSALNNNVCRLALIYHKFTHIITKECLSAIPDIDWSDPRVVTDEGLLEVCGCPKNKAKEYAEYCRKYMKEFDNKNNKK